MLDAIDTAFLARWQRRDDDAIHPGGDCTVHDAAAPVAVPATPTETAVDPTTVDAPDRSRTRRGDTATPPTAAADAPLVDRLLAAAWSDWHALAACVEDARLAGRRVIAIAGSRPREGRTTLVACLAAALRARGRDVICADPHDCAEASAPGGRSHDRRIVLLDAGVWFPPGPLHRQRLLVASLGVDAAILVRRSDAPGGTARRAALESLGIEVLGEVLTFTPQPEDAPDATHHDGDASR